jgi:hypothetical protein
MLVFGVLRIRVRSERTHDDSEFGNVGIVNRSRLLTRTCIVHCIVVYDVCTCFVQLVGAALSQLIPPIASRYMHIIYERNEVTPIACRNHTFQRGLTHARTEEGCVRMRYRRVERTVSDKRSGKRSVYIQTLVSTVCITYAHRALSGLCT